MNICPVTDHHDEVGDRRAVDRGLRRSSHRDLGDNARRQGVARVGVASERINAANGALPNRLTHHRRATSIARSITLQIFEHARLKANHQTP